MLKWFATRYTKKRDDEVWSDYEMFGLRKVERVNWLHAAMYRSWEQKTDRVQGILLLSTENLVFHLGINHTEIPLKAITNIDWAEALGSVVLLYTDGDQMACGAAFDFDVPGQSGQVAFGLKEVFAGQLRSQCALVWSETEDITEPVALD